MAKAPKLVLDGVGGISAVGFEDARPRLRGRTKAQERSSSSPAGKSPFSVVDAAKIRQNKREEIRIDRTRPDRLLRHDISDEELEMLSRDNSDGLSEKFWGFISAAVGAAPSALEALWKSYIVAPATPLSIVHLIEIIIVAAGIIGASIIWWLGLGRKTRTDTMVEAIRARTATHH